MGACADMSDCESCDPIVILMVNRDPASVSRDPVRVFGLTDFKISWREATLDTRARVQSNDSKYLQAHLMSCDQMSWLNLLRASLSSFFRFKHDPEIGAF